MPSPTPSTQTRPGNRRETEQIELRVVDGGARDLVVSVPDGSASLLSLLRPLGVDPSGITDLALDGQPVDALSSIDEVGLGRGSTLAVGRAGETLPAGGPAMRRRTGPHLRPARIDPKFGDPTVVMPEVPKSPPDPPSFPWLMALAPLPIAAVMATLLGPRMAVFAALGPLMVVARYAEGRRVARRERRRHDRELGERGAELTVALTRAADLVAGALRTQHPAPAELPALVSDGTRLWMRRPGTERFLHVRIGIGEAGWEPILSGPPGCDAYEAIVEAAGTLRDVPVIVDLSEEVLGIAGAREDVENVLRSIVADLVVHSGPADLELELAGDIDVGLWDPLKWLRHEVHLSSTSGVPGRSRLVLIDGSRQLREGRGIWPDVALAAGAGPDRAVVVFADAIEDLPAECTTVLHLDRAGARLSRPFASIGLRPAALDDRCFERIARALAPIDDPEFGPSAGALPVRSGVASLLGPLSSHDLQRSWSEARPDRLVATIGVGAGGPLEIDLVADGPHALAAGTTGAGKSELLRTLVLTMACRQSPSDCSFVLIDYKGGGAFDACADLPHTAAVVTDLDDHLARRAVRGLRAELRRREEVLRNAAVGDLVAFRRAGGQLARLIVVVDEFATLAAELPSFLDSLVDIAQRGRSLGIHLVLATQRPAGVLDAKIRANTNLRICLRVQDVADSIDVIGSDVAGRVDRSSSGRGFLRLGEGEIEPFQAGYSGALLEDRAAGSIARTFGLVDGVENHRDPWSDASTTELDAISVRLREAAEAAGSPPPRPPWLDPLPDRIDLAGVASELRGLTCPPGVVGVLDDPDRHGRCALAHDATTGNLLVVGADVDATTNTVLAVGRAVASNAAPSSVHIHRIAMGVGRRDWLEALPHHGTTVDGADLAQVERLVDALQRSVDQRRRHPDRPSPSLVVLADGLGVLFETLADDGDRELLARLNALLRDGSAVGLTFVGAARSLRSLPGLARAAMSTVWLHRLADAGDYATFGLRPREVPPLRGNAVIDPVSGLHGVVGDLAPLHLEIEVEPRVLGSTVEPLRLASVGETVRRNQLDRIAERRSSHLVLPVGLTLDRGVAATLDLVDSSPALVVGRTGSGRTNLLDHLAAEAETLDGIGVRRVGTNEDVRKLLEGRERPTLVIVDDIDLRRTDDLGWLASSPRGCDHPLWIVVAAQPGSFRRGLGPLRTLRGVEQGFVLGLEDPPVELFNARFPRRRPEASVPGRGWLVGAGSATPTQAVLCR